jgi:hypothetical protein
MSAAEKIMSISRKNIENGKGINPGVFDTHLRAVEHRRPRTSFQEETP